MRIIDAQNRGIVASRSDVHERVQQPGDVVIVYRSRARLLVLGCPCGCGDALTINLDVRAGPAWRVYNTEGPLTVFPSVWRDSGCGSHFIVWRGRILLFGGKQDMPKDDDQEPLGWFGGAILPAEHVLAAMPLHDFVSVADLADRVSALPWEVLATCRHLKARGLAIEGGGARRGSFRRLDHTGV